MTNYKVQINNTLKIIKFKFYLIKYYQTLKTIFEI